MTNHVNHLMAVLPDDLIIHIMSYLFNGIVDETISYAFLSKKFLNSIKLLVNFHVFTLILQNPILDAFYTTKLALKMKNNLILVPLLACQLFLKEDDMANFHVKHFFLFLRVSLFSGTASEDLRSKSQEILNLYLNDKIDEINVLFKPILDDKSKIQWFPIVYEYALNNLTNLKVLKLCSKYFNHTEEFIAFLVYYIPENMQNYLIPYDENERTRLFQVMLRNDMKYWMMRPVLFAFIFTCSIFNLFFRSAVELNFVDFYIFFTLFSVFYSIFNEIFYNFNLI